MHHPHTHSLGALAGRTHVHAPSPAAKDRVQGQAATITSLAFQQHTYVHITLPTHSRPQERSLIAPMASGSSQRDTFNHLAQWQKEVQGVKQEQVANRSQTPFVYPPLPAEDGLRLLILHPSTGNGAWGPLEGTLTSVPFSAKPKYLSLSYTWGDYGGNEPEAEPPRARPYIVLNGRRFEIGPNLASALLRLRSGLVLKLWVDQICINQADVAERNAQVALMAFIYSRAATVVSWLGPTLRHYDLAEEYHDMFVLVKDAPPHHLATGSFHFADDSLADMSPTDAYWSRMWIVQEVCLAPAIVFLTGGGLWSEQQITKLVLQHSSSQTTAAAAATGESPLARLVKARTNRFTSAMRLEALIERFMHCGCREKRDRVYGLVGLANDVDSVTSAEEWRQVMGHGPARTGGRGRGAILIDYDRAFYDIWCDVVELMHFRAKPQLDFGREPHDLEDERKVRLVRFAGVVQHALDGNIPTVAPLLRTCLDDRGSVVAKGYIAGRIASLGPTYTEFIGSFRSRQRWVGSWEAQYGRDEDLAKLREMEEKYEVKIIGYSKAELDLIVPIDSPETVAWSPLHIDGAATPAGVTFARRGGPDDNPASEPRRFLGDDLCMGLAPSTAQEGDLVVRFWNCDAAIVVRETCPADQEEGGLETDALFRLVGRADIAENYKRDNGLDNHAKDKMVVYQAHYKDPNYLWPGEVYSPGNKIQAARTKAMYVSMDFATLQNITVDIGL